MLGYSKKPFAKSEIVITSALALVIGLFVLSFLLLENLTEGSVNFLVYVISGLVISFVFPKIYYFLKIDFGNIIIAGLWFILMILLYSISGTNIILRIPLIMYSYMHIMRVLHFFATHQVPAYNAHWSTVGSLDKQAERKISEDDLLFTVLYGLIPVFTMLVIAWWQSVYGN